MTFFFLKLVMIFGVHSGTTDGVFEVPFWVYKRNGSSDGGFAATHSQREGLGFNVSSVVLNTENVAATLSVLLGIPVPRHSQGVFIEQLSGLIYNSTLLHSHRFVFCFFYFCCLVFFFFGSACDPFLLLVVVWTCCSKLALFHEYWFSCSVVQEPSSIRM